MNAQQFKIKWFYSKDRRTTTCRIYKGEELVSEASTNRADSDVFIKDVGRRLSMSRAIKDFSKEERTIVWDGYKEMRPISKWIKTNH